MTKRIMHIAEASGGVERYLVTLLTKFRKYSEFEHILVCSDTFDTKKFKGLVLDAVCVSTMHNAISAKEDFKSICRVRKLIKHYKPDIVYCHSSKAGAIGRIADIGIRNLLIYNAHGWSFNIKGISSKKVKFYQMIEKILSLFTDKIVCISEYEQKSALERGICKKEKLIVINNGIDFDEYRSIQPKSREELGIPNDAFVVGTIGRLAEQKSPDVFVKMAEQIKSSVDNAYFIIVGDGPERDATEKAIEATGLGNCFIITGWVDNPLDYVGVFDVATLLSRWEGFGLVLPEYMIAGKPIVASNVDAIPYVVGNAGILVDPNDYKSAAESVIRLKNEIELKNQLINNGEERVLLFDVQRTADEHSDLFR